ncbi:electron transport complex subunit RsxC [Pontiella sulfatireligans]|uniref:Ion-translocating oxidoreductase complex subunit C n=1 Tax=Pontiella sulfatireligans TaxID=2750658 RepID=A0A6C2UST0_9BACT|nr:electron transport complex subunit RsxC [Pontiella sulfatireligans]VGO23013.1 Electron transport complex subunit RnfC [Pontiella sulfatireligans]
MSDKPRKFKGGVHPNDSKALSATKPIQEAPLLESYKVIMHQNIGGPPELVVKKGDTVKKGDLLAKASGFVSVPLHAPTSGTIKAIDKCAGPTGIHVPAIEITADGEDEWGEAFAPIADWKNTDPATLKQRVWDAGIVGMGGAGFPCHVKLSPPEGKTIDTLILNGAECEPYLTADHRIMLEQAEEVVLGAAILARILGLKTAIIGIENNKPDAIAKLNEVAGKYNVRVQGLPVNYPQGAEKQLIYAITGREVSPGKLPMDVHCVVQNVASAAAVAGAVIKGRPSIERITTVTGKPVVQPGNWKFRIGTPISKALELVGGVSEQPAKLLLGGPMMGIAQNSLDVTVMKNTSGILLISADEVSFYTSEPCIRCGRCVECCPMSILPATISQAVENKRFDWAEELNVMNCIECGSCSYVCPSHRPLNQHFKRAKIEIQAQLRKKK